MSPLQKLTKSRKFLIAVLDLVVSLTLFFVGKYALGSLEDAKFLIAAIQPLALTLIGAIAYEDGQEKRSGTFIPDPPEAVG